jgi:hypothetical protein
MGDMTPEQIHAAFIESAAAAAPELRGRIEDVYRAIVERQERRDSLDCRTHATAECPEAIRDVCEFRTNATVCPLFQRKPDRRRNLTDAKVPRNEYDLLMAHWRKEKPLKPSAAIMAVSAWLDGKAWVVEETLATGSIAAGARILVLSGPTGVGKTLAACYGIGKIGGRYTTAYPFARINGVVVDELIGVAGLLCIDQLDFDGAGVPAYAAQQIREVLDRRFAERRRTVLCANMSRADFATVFKQTMVDRIGGWVALQGESMRHGEAA